MTSNTTIQWTCSVLRMTYGDTIMSNYEEMAVWPDYTVCNIEELDDFLTFMSDDFAIIRIDLDTMTDDENVHDLALEQYRSQYEGTQ